MMGTNYLSRLIGVMLLLVCFNATLMAQDDDDLLFKSGKGKVQLKENQFYYVSGDTISFFADAFVLPEGAMLDRLLRKLPGVEYRSNGNIIIDGTTVKEMRLEGKEYFKNVMTSVVKRIPAYCIDQVKFYDYDQGKRMNLILKKKYKGKWFAEFSAGLGPEGRYSEKAFAMKKGKNSRVTLFGNANDINDTRQPGQETEWSPASMSKNEVNSQIAGMDYQWKKKNQDMIGYATVSHSVTDATTDVDKTNLMLSGNTYQQTNSSSRKRSTKINTYHDYHARFGSYDIHIKPKFTYNDFDNTSAKTSFLTKADSTLVNSSSSGTSSVGNNYNASIVASVSYKFDNKRKQLKYEMGGTTKGGKQDDYNDEAIHYYNLDRDSLYQYSQRLFTKPQKEAEYYFKGEYQWTGKGLLGVLQYKFKHNYLHEAMNETAPYSDNSYDSREQRNTHEVVFKMHYERPTAIGTWTLNAFVPVDLVSRRLGYLRHDYGRDLQHHYVTADVKNTYLQWRSRDTQRRITMLYDVTTALPDADMYQDVANTIDRQNYYLGNPSVDNQTTHQLRLKYLFLSLDTRHEFSIMLKENIVRNAIVTRLTSYDKASGRRLYTYDNVNGNNALTATVTYGTPLNRSTSLYLHNTLESGFNHKVSLDDTKGDTQRKEAEVYTVDNDLRLKWLISRRHIITLRTRFQMSYSDNNGTVTKPIDWECGLLAQLHLPWQLDLSTDFVMYKRQNYKSQELNTTDWVCNARLAQPFFKDKLLIVLEGFDIFHQLKNITHVVSSDVITNTRTNVVPSYAMLCAVYRLNYKKVSNKDKVHWF